MVDMLGKEMQDMGSNAWKIIERMNIINQSGFDVFPAVNNVLKASNIRRLSLMGDKTTEVSQDALFKSMSEANVFNAEGLSGHWSKTAVGEKIINILFRTLKKNNMMSNDVYDESGSRPPEPSEIRKQVRRMRSFLDNPNRFLLDQLQYEIGNIKSKNQAEALMKETMELFYPDQWNPSSVVYKDKIIEWQKDFMAGKTLPAPANVFKFSKDINKLSCNDRYEQATKTHNGFKNLFEVNRSHFYTDDVAADINAEFYPGLMNSVGMYVDGMIGRINFIRATGGDVYKKNAEGEFEFKITDPMLDFTDNIGSKHSIKEAIQRGIVLSTLNKEYSDLTRELRYLSY